jgi:hypothetical protein
VLDVEADVFFRDIGSIHRFNALCIATPSLPLPRPKLGKCRLLGAGIATDPGDFMSETNESIIPAATGVASPQFSPISGPVLAGALVLTIAILSGLFFPQWMTKPNYAPSDWADALKSEMTNSVKYSQSTPTTGETLRLLEQVQHISNRAKHHFDVMQFFYLNYYVELLLGSIFGGLSALALVLLTKTGWDRADRYLISFFLTTTVSAAFFIGFPKLCKMDENVAKNKALYVKYVSLLNDARSFVTVGDFVQDTKPATPLSTKEFILRLDAEMKKANDVVVSFDPGKFPVYKISTDNSGK